MSSSWQVFSLKEKLYPFQNKNKLQKWKDRELSLKERRKFKRQERDLKREKRPNLIEFVLLLFEIDSLFIYEIFITLMNYSYWNTFLVTKSQMDLHFDPKSVWIENSFLVSIYVNQTNLIKNWMKRKTYKLIISWSNRLI